MKCYKHKKLMKQAFKQFKLECKMLLKIWTELGNTLKLNYNKNKTQSDKNIPLKQKSFLNSYKQTYDNYYFQTQQTTTLKQTCKGTLTQTYE